MKTTNTVIEGSDNDLKMTKFDFIGLEYKLKHALTNKNKRIIIDSYPDLKGKSLQKVKKLIAVNKMLMTGKSLAQQKKENIRRFWYAKRSVI